MSELVRISEQTPLIAIYLWICFIVAMALVITLLMPDE